MNSFSKLPPAFEVVAATERLYARLMRLTDASDAAHGDWEKGLGGKLLYAAELTDQTRALILAGNIAGCATLCTTADPDMQKLAVRQGIADFLVNSLDEALRILKNEVRKSEAVAVCVAAVPHAIELEMLERGVLPDIVATEQLHQSFAAEFYVDASASQSGMDAVRVYLSMEVTESPARWMPKLDAIALEALPASDMIARRWVRIAPRYLGRIAQGLRVIRCEPGAAKAIEASIVHAVQQGQIAVAVKMSIAGIPA